MAFQKGSSGNPQGRSSQEVHFANRARLRAAEKAPEIIEELIKIAMDQEVKHSIRLAAMDKVLDRGLGRPLQFLNLTEDDTVSASNMSNEQLNYYVARNSKAFLKSLYETGQLSKFIQEFDEEKKGEKGV